jgi:hypothetical protein
MWPRRAVTSQTASVRCQVLRSPDRHHRTRPHLYHRHPRARRRPRHRTADDIRSRNLPQTSHPPRNRQASQPAVPVPSYNAAVRRNTCSRPQQFRPPVFTRPGVLDFSGEAASGHVAALRTAHPRLAQVVDRLIRPCGLRSLLSERTRGDSRAHSPSLIAARRQRPSAQEAEAACSGPK